ncbi:hypothetical protein F4781DRAFT_437937 [Annulohypoxylon bovei var. microspora]|nr:hypothetical protein F4781DRAFT_437937 [Annulohypoxylon bovei var. microspora]
MSEPSDGSQEQGSPPVPSYFSPSSSSSEEEEPITPTRPIRITTAAPQPPSQEEPRFSYLPLRPAPRQSDTTRVPVSSDANGTATSTAPPRGPRAQRLNNRRRNRGRANAQGPTQRRASNVSGRNSHLSSSESRPEANLSPLAPAFVPRSGGAPTQATAGEQSTRQPATSQLLVPPTSANTSLSYAPLNQWTRSQASGTAHSMAGNFPPGFGARRGQPWGPMRPIPDTRGQPARVAPPVAPRPITRRTAAMERQARIRANRENVERAAGFESSDDETFIPNIAGRRRTQ